MINSARPATIIDMQSFPPSTSRYSPVSLPNTDNLKQRWPFFNGITGLTLEIPQSKARPFIPTTPSQPSVVEDAARVQVRSRARANNEPSASRWRTKEFYCYYALVAIAVPYMAKVVIDLSKGTQTEMGHYNDPSLIVIEGM
jgi:hypothetical protein